MSKLGKWLLTHCDSNLHIDLRQGSPMRSKLIQAEFNFIRARTTCLFLGITLEGGS